MRKTLPLTLLGILLGGCAGIGFQFRAANEPQEGERARVRVISRDVAVTATPNRTCPNYSEPRAGVALGRNLSNPGYRGRSIGMPSAIPAAALDDSAEMYAVAGEPITFVHEEAFSADRCKLKPVTFIPEAGKDYEIRYVYNYRMRRCSVSVKSLTDDAMLENTKGSYCR